MSVLVPVELNQLLVCGILSQFYPVHAQTVKLADELHQLNQVALPECFRGTLVGYFRFMAAHLLLHRFVNRVKQFDLARFVLDFETNIYVVSFTKHQVEGVANLQSYFGEHLVLVNFLSLYV